MTYISHTPSEENPSPFITLPHIKAEALSCNTDKNAFFSIECAVQLLALCRVSRGQMAATKFASLRTVLRENLTATPAPTSAVAAHRHAATPTTHSQWPDNCCPQGTVTSVHSLYGIMECLQVVYCYVNFSLLVLTVYTVSPPSSDLRCVYGRRLRENLAIRTYRVSLLWLQ